MWLSSVFGGGDEASHVCKEPVGDGPRVSETLHTFREAPCIVPLSEGEEGEDLGSEDADDHPLYFPKRDGARGVGGTGDVEVEGSPEADEEGGEAAPEDVGGSTERGCGVPAVFGGGVWGVVAVVCGVGGGCVREG